MKPAYFQYYLRSLVSRIALLALLVLLPIVGLLFYNITLTRRTLMDQVKSTHTGMLDGYTVQLENEMDAVSFYLINQLYYESDAQIISESSDNAAVQYACKRIADSQKKQLMVSDYMDGLFLYIKETDGYASMISSVSHRHISLTQQDLIDYLSGTESAQQELPAWEIVSIGEEDYLFYVIGSSENSRYAGAYVKVSQLLSLLSYPQGSDHPLYLLSANDLQSFQASLPADQLVTSSALHENLVLAEILSRSGITEGLPTLPRYGLLEVLLVLLLLGLLIEEIIRLVIFPILRLSGDMYAVEQGDLDHRTPENKTTTEIGILTGTFNRMLDNIKHLTVDVMEKQLNVQKAQLRNLQLQIKPHFLINSLNMIYNLIETGQYSNAQKLILHSVNYFRYMTKVDEDLVPLNEEIEHIKSYLEIQTLRYKGTFIYEIDIDQMVEDMLLPPMLIQNFIENSIKYALNTEQNNNGEPLKLSVTVTSFEKDYYPYATITVRDTGAGYPEEMLAALNAGRHIHKKDGTHIGLRNTTQRLAFLFGDKASWNFANEGGAVSTVTLPVTFEEE